MSSQPPTDRRDPEIPTPPEHAEGARRLSEARFRALFENLLDVLTITDATGCILLASPSVERVLGHRPDELRGQSVFDLVHPEEREIVRGVLEETMQYPGSTRTAICRVRHGDGSWRLVESVGRSLIGDPLVPGVLITTRDITERRRTEEALAESERMLATLLSNLPGMTYRCRNDPDWTMEFVSEGCRALTGYHPADLIAGTPTYASIIVPEDRDGVWAEVQAAVAEVRPFLLTYRITHRDGGTRWVWEKGRAVPGPTGEVVSLEGFMTDVTERRRLGEELQQSRKMEAIGQLAGGIAHDFNNLLTAILGYSELLVDALDADDIRRADALEIQRAGRIAADLTQQLLAFSRRQILAPRVLDLNAVIGGLEGMLRPLVGEHISLDLRLAPDLGRVLADRSQIEQVLVDLAAHARDAMPEGGTITVETANVVVPGELSARFGLASADCVLLTVRDTGAGVDEDMRRRVFEPFYTTRERGRGEGLGLATVYGIVKQSGGGIWLESEPDQGSAFKVCLPRVDAPDEVDAPVDTFLPSTARLMLVEDDPGVRGFACAVLRRHGFSVIEAPGGRQALELATASPPAIDVLITDVVMPEMSGRQLADRLRASRPDLRVLFMSGYTDDTIVHHGVLDPGVNFLQKPFSAQTLLTRVRDILGR